jgi:outer membrane immunogenic protein
MKIVLIAATSAAALLAAVPAMAQPELGPMTPQIYGALGYGNFDDHSDTSAVQGRLGVRAGKYFGVEGEAATGFATGQTHVLGGDDHVRLKGEYAGYAVGYLPVLPNADLFARVGYGATDTEVTGPGLDVGNYRSGVTYGAGAQYFFNGPNGVRADYTRMDFGPTTGQSNVWSLAYVRKF